MHPSPPPSPSPFAGQPVAGDAHESERGERRYAMLFQQAADAVFLFDERGVVTLANEAAGRMFRLAPLALVGRNVHALLEPLQLLADPLRYGELVPGGVLLTERTMLRADGTSFPAEINTARLEDGSFQGIVRDVSERRRAEELLEDQRRRLASLLEAAPALMCTLRGPDHVVETANREFRHLLGDRPLADRPLADAAPELAGGPLLRRLDEVLATGTAYTRMGAPDLFVALARAAGREWYFDVVLQPILEADGTRSGVFLHAVDVSERVQVISEQQRVADAVRQSEARFRLVMERAADLIAILDADGTIRYASPSYAHGMGYDLESVYGLSVFDLLHPDDRPGILVLWDRLRAGELLREPAEFRARHSNGTWRIMSGVARNLLHEPAVRGVVVSWRDITDQRAAEAQFRQAHKMEAIGRLAGGVAHDLNNILTVIQANTEFLKPAVPPDGLEELQEIGKATKRAASLTRQLLAFSRQQVLAPRLVDPNEVIGDLGRMLARLVGEDVEIALSLDPGAGYILVDPGQLEQVLMNLVVNARDAMPRGGVISIATARLSPAAAGSGDAATRQARTAIVVADTGSGIPDEVRARMFEPFYTTKPAGLGTGLGLSTVLGIVEQSGGTVDVQSGLGRGTTFTIQFPEAPDPVAEWRGAPEGQLTAGTSAAILVVEDDPSLRAVASRILRSRGYRVIEARDGVEALDAVARRAPPVDLVLSDVVLPAIGGAELLRRLHETDPELPVVLVSGYTDDELLRRGVMAGETRFIQKPYGADMLHRAVEEALAAARLHREATPTGKTR